MMKQPFNFIISPLGDNSYNNTVKVGDKELIVNTSIEDAQYINRIGIVKSLPNNYNGVIKVNDQVVVQHNVFRIYLDGKGNPRNSDNHIKDNLYSVSSDLIYLIIRDGKKIASDDYIFAKPIEKEDEWFGKITVPNQGIATYINDNLKKQGVKEGSKITFKSHSDYKFDLFGETYFMMRNKRVLGVLFS